MKHIFALVLWTIIVILGSILIVRNVTSAQTFDIQPDQRVKLQHDSSITTDIPVTIEAASTESFVIENEDKTDKIEGVSSKVPLYLDEDTYYYANPQPIAAGVWTVSEADGKIEIQISADSPTTIHVKLAPVQQELNLVIPITMAFLFWALGACVYGMFVTN